MENEFFYEFNCIEDGEWISEKVTLEDRLVQDLRFIFLPVRPPLNSVRTL